MIYRFVFDDWVLWEFWKFDKVIQNQVCKKLCEWFVYLCVEVDWLLKFLDCYKIKLCMVGY